MVKKNDIELSWVEFKIPKSNWVEFELSLGKKLWVELSLFEFSNIKHILLVLLSIHIVQGGKNQFLVTLILVNQAWKIKDAYVIRPAENGLDQGFTIIPYDFDEKWRISWNNRCFIACCASVQWIKQVCFIFPKYEKW